MQRREFIQYGLVGLSGVYGVGDLRKLSSIGVLPPTLGTLFLNGGLDALSVIQPTDKLVKEKLKKYRPNLMFDGGRPIAGVESYQVNPILKNLSKLISEGAATVILGADTGHDSFSHFGQRDFLLLGGLKRSMNSGIYGRALKEVSHNKKEIAAFNMGRTFFPDLLGDHFILPGDFLGEKSLEKISDFKNKNSILPSDCNSLKDFKSLYNICQEKDLLLKNNKAIDKIQSFKLPNKYKTSNSLEGWLQITEKALRAYKKAPFYSLQLGGWDTHFDQNNRLKKLLTQLDRAIGKHYESFLKTNEGKNSMLVIVSEFGRALPENSSRGTEHGYGGLTIVVGHPKSHKRKHLLPQPSELLKGDFVVRKYPIFNIYGELFTKHMGLPESSLKRIFPHHKYQRMGLMI